MAELFPEPSYGEATRRLGVVGTLVWDTIHRRGGLREPVREWGGIGYALEALSVVLPLSWEILPAIKVGRDLAEPAFQFLNQIPRVRNEPGVRVVPQPNNQVELHYGERGRRSERLRGGVPPWTWTELSPLAEECDALYVNFISGMEMELATAQALREGYQGPLYADLHSLFLGIGAHGDRVPRPLPHWWEWLRCFDAVQMNEDEFEMLGRARGDPWSLAAEVVGPEVKLIAVTLGEEGAAYVAGPGFDPNPFTWPALRSRLATPGTSVSGTVPPSGPLEDGDPTGCGDVWGATCFSTLLAGEGLEEAIASANRVARENVRHMGAQGLGRHLARRLGAQEDG